MKKASTFYKLRIHILSFLLCGCVLGSTPQPLAVLPAGCTTPGTLISADLPQPQRGYPYTYRVYLPPCFSSDHGSYYPILYLVPGRGDSPDGWFNAGLAAVVDPMIMSREIPPFIIVATENIDNDPMAETISQELIPYVESQYPIINHRKYRAVAGGSLGGIAAYRLAFQYPETFSSAGIFGAGAISGEEKIINGWLSSMTEENRLRVFMNTGNEDPLMLERAEVMKSLLDEMNVENILLSGPGGHNYTYWISNFEVYLRWLAADWE